MADLRNNFADKHSMLVVSRVLTYYIDNEAFMRNCRVVTNGTT